MLLQKVLALQKDQNKDAEENKHQDPFSKAVMHIISKEYYKESAISEVLKNLIFQCLKEWDELQKLYQIISDKEELQKAINQIATVLSQEMQVKSIQRNTPIFFYGDKDDQIYYVIKGTVQLFIPKSQKEIWEEVDFNRRLQNASNDQKVLENKDRFDIVINAIQKMKGSHIDLIKQNDKLKKKYFDENQQVSKIKKVQHVKPKQMFGEISYLLEKPRPYTAIASEECYFAIFEPKVYRRALGEYFQFINCKNIYLNNYFSSIRKETIFHLSISFHYEIKLYLGDYLFREGEQGDRIYLLKQGKIEFQRRIASSSILHEKRKNLKKLNQKQKEKPQQKSNQKPSVTMQSLTRLSQLDEQDDTQQENNKNIKRVNKKKKTFQVQDLEDPTQESINEMYQSKKINDQLNVSSFGPSDQIQSMKIASMVQFDEIENNTKEIKKTKEKFKQNEKNVKNDNQEDFKYKEVSLGIIQQGEFFGFEDILISSSNNFSQNISQNRRTYSAKVTSSDAIVFSIERSALLKILSQNEVLDQDIKTKALIKIQYHQQRIDSLKRFEDIKNVNLYQKVPLKEMLKDKYLQMDLRAANQRTQHQSINNLPKIKDIKINIEQIDNSSAISQPPSLNQTPQQNQFNLSTKEEQFDNIQRQQSLTKKQDINIKQEKKIVDDIDCLDELNIPKDISKGNIQFLKFHNGQFSDLKSMKQSFLDQEERYKQIKKTKHSVNISDQNQLALERLYQKTNSPSIKNYQEIILKKNSSAVKSSFNKQIDSNIPNHQDESSKKDETENQNQNQPKGDDDDNQNSPSHKKLKLILTKNKTLKTSETQPYAKDISLVKNKSFHSGYQENLEKINIRHSNSSKIRSDQIQDQSQNGKKGQIQNDNLDLSRNDDKNYINCLEKKPSQKFQTNQKYDINLIFIQKCEDQLSETNNQFQNSCYDQSAQNQEEINSNNDLSTKNNQEDQIGSKKMYQLKLSEILTPKNLKKREEKEYFSDQLSNNNESIVVYESGKARQIDQNKNSNNFSNQFLELPKIFLSGDRELLRYNIHNQNKSEQKHNIDSPPQQSQNNYGEQQEKKTQFQINQNPDCRSKSMNNLEDHSKMGSFSSFLPSLIHFDFKYDQETNQTLENKAKTVNIKQKQSKNTQKSSIDIQTNECKSSQSIYINQYLQRYNNPQQIVMDLKQHLNDKTNSQDVSTYINMRNKSLPSLCKISNHLINSDTKKSFGESDSRNSSPQKTKTIKESLLGSLNSSPLLEQKKALNVKLRNFEINLNRNTQISHQLELNHPDIKFMLSSKSTKKSGDYFKNLFSNPRHKFSVQ